MRFLSSSTSQVCLFQLDGLFAVAIAAQVTLLADFALGDGEDAKVLGPNLLDYDAEEVASRLVAPRLAMGGEAPLIWHGTTSSRAPPGRMESMDPHAGGCTTG